MRATNPGKLNTEGLQEIKDTSDPRDAYVQVRKRISAYRAEGRDIPDALKRMERTLFVECCAQSQGR
ncbi:MAG: hypothetical protein AB7K67_14640 [Hyphomicrobiaceae bacterium]|jgi:hypothetical protein